MRYVAKGTNRTLKSVGKVNISMIIMLFIIVVYGLVILYSVSGPTGYANFGDSGYYVKKQILNTLIGMVACFVIAFIPVQFFNKRWIMVGVYGLSLFLIILTRFVGIAHNNARRWINLGIEFQTSELLKLAVILAYAIYRAMIISFRKKGKLKAANPKYQDLNDSFFDFILPVGCIVLLDFFVLIQPHMSCFLIIAAITVVCFLCSGIKLKSWLIGIAVYIPVILVCVTVFLFVVPSGTRENVLSEFSHVAKRINIFVSQDSEEEATDLTADDTRQIDSANNALGSGGLWGLGIGNSRSKYSYVSEAHNDYIFSIYVEETGMIGGTILILLYMAIFYMGFSVARKATSVFARIIAMGYTFLIVIEAVLNIAVELRVIPATGITLPFISYGGTAQMLLLVAYGMILCVSKSGTTPVAKEIPTVAPERIGEISKS